ncbi:MAG: hypothetical protein KDF65_09785, partial [Anaerolineae bacterium]|nr:hypothetical protein [Anaerolineae bacterium]
MTAVHRGVRLATFLVLILIVAGCAAATPPAPEPTAPPTPEPQPTATAPRTAKLTLAAGSPGDDGYPLGVALG